MSELKPYREWQVDKLQIQAYQNRQEMGQAAGRAAAVRIRRLLEEKKTVNIVFAAAPSQNEFLETLINEQGIDWSRINAFHLDDYVGLPDSSPQRFRAYLQQHIFSAIKPGQVNFIDSASPSVEAECKRYSQLLKEHPLDIACIGIGENGHIAFNDPPVADFMDPHSIKVVELEESCRRQQVNDGCFPRLEDVPTHAFSLTIPTILSAHYIYCMVPGPTKARAVKETLAATITTACPATALRSHQRTILYIDRDSGALI